jgi:hypothetical protein
MRRQMDYIARWPAFGITPEIREKLMKISPAIIGRTLKKTGPQSTARRFPS